MISRFRSRKLGVVLLWGYFFVLLVSCLYAAMPLFSAELASFDAVGWDFLNLYTGAHMVLHGQGESLYNLEAQIQWQAMLLSPRRIATEVLPFPYPPTILPFLLPFALVSLSQGYFLWMVFCGVLLMAIFLLLRRHLQLGRLDGVTFFLAILSFFPLLVHLMQGQTALLVLLGSSLAYVWLRQGREFWAGLALALGSVKPPLVLPVLLVLLGKRRWSALAGFLAGVIALVGPTFFLLGPPAYIEYVRLSWDSMDWSGNYGIFPGAMQNWRSLAFRLLGPGTGGDVLLLVLTLFSLGALAWLWRGLWQPAGSHFPLQFAATILLTTLVSPHLYTHDLVLWLLAGALLAYHIPPLQGVKGMVLKGILLLGLAAPLLAMLIPGIVLPPTVLVAAIAVGFLFLLHHSILVAVYKRT